MRNHGQSQTGPTKEQLAWIVTKLRNRIVAAAQGHPAGLTISVLTGIAVDLALHCGGSADDVIKFAEQYRDAAKNKEQPIALVTP